MRISRVHIRKYRCVEDLVLDVADYTVLVGPNGSGKSSVLYALDWFFNGRALSTDDLHCCIKDGQADEEGPACVDETHAEPETDVDDLPSQIDVEVTFSDLDPEDRRILGKYGRGRTARFRRSWSSTDSKEKMIGDARQGPGFRDLRALTKITEMRSQYKALREQLEGLPEVPQQAAAEEKAQILDALKAWEDDDANLEKLVEIKDEDATHMFGIDGEHKLARRMRLILVPAATDMLGQVGSSAKTSAVAQLVGNLMAEACSAAKLKWEAEHAEALATLSDAIKTDVERSTRLQEERVNSMFTTLVPKASVAFVPQVPQWSLRGDASVLTDVVVDGYRKDISRQGHGVQRAVMMSMLQALVPDASLVKGSFEGGGEEPADDSAKLRAELQKLPALLVCIEEPEIYQHPVRARHFARVLSLWAKKESSQVLFATHSPYFVLPEQFEALRRFHLVDGKTVASRATIASVTGRAGVEERNVVRAMEKQIPRTFSEGFFADAVVFTEGDTDRVVLEALSERLGMSLDAQGISVLSMDGKDNYLIPRSILEELGIRVYVTADADAKAAARRHPDNEAARSNSHESHKKSTEKLLSWLPTGSQIVGDLPFSFGDTTTVTSDWTLFEDDLEDVLSEWPQYVQELDNVGAVLRSKSVAHYRAAATDAGLENLPALLEELVKAITAFGARAN